MNMKGPKKRGKKEGMISFLVLFTVSYMIASLHCTVGGKALSTQA